MVKVYCTFRFGYVVESDWRGWVFNPSGGRFRNIHQNFRRKKITNMNSCLNMNYIIKKRCTNGGTINSSSQTKHFMIPSLLYKISIGFSLLPFTTFLLGTYYGTRRMAKWYQFSNVTAKEEASTLYTTLVAALISKVHQKL